MKHTEPKVIEKKKSDDNVVKIKKSKKRNIEPRTIHLKKSEGTANLYDWIHTLVYAVAIVVLLLTFFLRLVDVSGTSMVPTLQSKDKVSFTLRRTEILS